MNHIHYVETYHECDCDCGEQFFVVGGRARIATIATKCPGCGIVERIHDAKDHREFIPILEQSYIAIPYLVFPDLTDLEKDAQEYKRLYHLALLHLTGLRNVVQSTIRHWEKDWQRAVMPRQFQTLVRVLQEQQSQDVGLVSPPPPQEKLPS
jgi:hypothetical protein